MPCSFQLPNGPAPPLSPVGCQFGVAESELHEQLGAQFCLLHLPHTARLKNLGGEPARARFLDELRRQMTIHATDSDMDLTGVQFPRKVSLRGVALPRDTTLVLAHAEFGRSCDLTGFDFGDDPILENVRFGRGCTFVGARFGEATNLRGAQFGRECDLSSCSFGVMSDLRDTRFGPRCKFDNASVGSHCSFHAATFDSECSFRNCQYGDAVSFERAAFNQACRFDDSKFSRCTFVDATFGHGASFERSTFGASADFGATDNSKSFGSISFAGVFFRGPVSFARRIFLATADFSGTTFTVAPDFDRSEMHQDTRFGMADFQDVSSGGAPAAYRTLKLHMEALRAHDEQGKFFALEQKAGRNMAHTRWHDRIASIAYEVVSNYGRDFSRPLWLLLALALLFFPSVYEAMAYSLAIPAPGNAVPFSIQQVVRPFEVWSSKYEADGNAAWVGNMLIDHPNWLRGLATIQSVVSISLVALFLLALRRRFKLD